jgi:hypothetical protein
MYDVISRNNTIDLKPINHEPYQAALQQMKAEAKHYEVDKSLEVRQYPYESDIYCQIGDDYYTFRLYVYYWTEEVTTDEGKLKNVRHYKNVYLWCWRDIEGGRVSVSRLDLSGYLDADASWRGFGMRITENKAVVLLNDHCLVVDLSIPQSLAVIEDKRLEPSFFLRGVGAGSFSLLPVESLDLQDRIRLSLVMAGRYQYRGGEVVVDEQSDPVSYVLISAHEGIDRYVFQKVENESVIFKRLDGRRFTILETLFGSVFAYWGNPQFIQDGKLYLSSGNTLMVFDVAGPRIRKLGHFQRVSYKYAIEDVKVVENGNILLLSRYDVGQGEDLKRTCILQLLKNPE